MNQPINYVEIFGRAKRPPEVKVEGVCPKCSHNLEDHIGIVCLADFLHNLDECRCAVSAPQNGGNVEMKLKGSGESPQAAHQSLEQMELRI